MPSWLSYVVPVLTLVAGYLGARLTKPKVDAEARKTSAEADDLIIGRLYREIGRLDDLITQMRADFDVREAAHEQEKNALRGKVSRLEKRVSGLENIFKTHPIPPEMQAELDKLNAIP